MTKRQVVTGTLAIAALSAGCQPTTTHQRFSTSPTQLEQPKVTVRFVSQPGLTLACGENCFDECINNPKSSLVSDNLSPCNMAGFVPTADGAIPQHAILWGNGFQGDNVTTGPTQLHPGSYSFAYFDPDRGAAYQGWIAVNSGGDDVLSALTEWRDTVHQQEEWLAFEYKINGKYKSHDPFDFNRFNGQLSNLRRLEGKLNAAIYAEQKDRQHFSKWQNQYLGDAHVVLMPGSGPSFGMPATLPAFQPNDLSVAQSGQPVTKVILAGNFDRAMQKLDRLNDLQSEMRRCRTVLSEEINRLENRRHYYRLTAHLYDHDQDFLGNEKRVQQARGLLAGVDRQITENRRHAHAVLAVVGLFAPDEANLAFEREQNEIKAERAVFAERLRQIETQFNDASMWNEKRVALEKQRQFMLNQIAECDVQLEQCDQAAQTVAQLRENTGVIYRNGPASVLAASFVTDSVPARLASAIEQESMLTIRLHAAEGVRPSNKHLTEGGFINEQMFEQMFIRTSHQPNQVNHGNQVRPVNYNEYGNPTGNDHGSDGDSDLTEYSNTQRGQDQVQPASRKKCTPWSFKRN